MKEHARIVRTMLLAAVAFFLCSCGGGTATEFDDPTLNDNRATIQADVTGAGIVFVGTITAIGTAPTFWSGIATSTQPVTYTVDSVLKGTYTESSITVNHLLVNGTRQAAETPGLSTTLFAVSGRLIVFASQNTDYESVGDDLEGPAYIDVDPNYGTIPYSSQNEDVINGMISSPSAQTVAKGFGFFPPAAGLVPTDKTLTISGSDADIASFNTLLDQCKARSATLSSLVDQIGNSETYAVTLNIERDGAGVFVDAFTGHKVDIKDLEEWHDGCDSKTDLCQLFGHILQEYWHEAVTGDGYRPSHATAIATENQIRSDLGKTTTLTGHWSVNQSGTIYMETIYGDNAELVKINGANVGEVTVRTMPPAAPTNLVADGSVSCRITLTWTDNATNEEGYSIERKDGASGSWVVIYGVAPDTTTWTNTTAEYPLTLGETYCYRIRAWRTGYPDWAYSAYSNESCATKQ